MLLWKEKLNKKKQEVQLRNGKVGEERKKECGEWEW